MNRIWMMRIARVPAEALLDRSAPNFLRAACLTRIDAMIMSPMTKRMKIHSADEGVVLHGGHRHEGGEDDEHHRAA